MRAILLLKAPPATSLTPLALFIAAASAIVLLLLYYTIRVVSINKAYRARFNPTGQVSLRKFPYPYKAALAICSDIDRTRTAEQFIAIQRFLNTEDPTEMGNGVGLEIGNSFFMCPRSTDVFSYFSNRPVDRVIIRRFIEAGYLDVLHSWGEGCKDRNDALAAVRELEANQLRVSVWVNHATVSNNLGFSFPNYALDKGDNKDTPYYHADVTIPYGIRYVWTGATTWLIGQAATLGWKTFAGSIDPRFPIRSAVNLLKAIIKHLMGTFRILRSRYSMHAGNDLVEPCILDDGQRVYQFIRYDNHYDGIGKGAFGSTSHYNLSPRIINQLKTQRAYAVLYTHLGITGDCRTPVCEDLQVALRYLAEQYRGGEVYVTTTSKLLRYYTVHKYLDWRCQELSDEVLIYIDGVDDPVCGRYLPHETDLQALTFYVPAGKALRIFVGDRQIAVAQTNVADETGRTSVSIPHTRLAFPRIDDLEIECDRLGLGALAIR